MCNLNLRVKLVPRYELAQSLIADSVSTRRHVRGHEVRMSKMNRNWSRCTVFV